MICSYVQHSMKCGIMVSKRLWCTISSKNCNWHEKVFHVRRSAQERFDFWNVFKSMEVPYDIRIFGNQRAVQFVVPFENIVHYKVCNGNVASSQELILAKNFVQFLKLWILVFTNFCLLFRIILNKVCNEQKSLLIANYLLTKFFKITLAVAMATLISLAVSINMSI